MSRGKHFPSPPDAGIFNALRFIRTPLRFLDVIQSRYRDGAEVSVPGGPSIVFITELGLCQEAMGRIDDFARVSAGGAAALIAENGLVQTEGERWRRQREAITPGFGSGPLETWVDGVADQGVRLRGEWADAVAGRLRRRHPSRHRLSRDLMCRLSLLPVALKPYSDTVSDGFRQLPVRPHRLRVYVNSHLHRLR
jgi:cytochrome P450